MSAAERQHLVERALEWQLETELERQHKAELESQEVAEIERHHEQRVAEPDLERRHETVLVHQPQQTPWSSDGYVWSSDEAVRDDLSTCTDEDVSHDSQHDDDDDSDCEVKQKGSVSILLFPIN